jgi:hypothetical protein
MLKLIPLALLLAPLAAQAGTWNCTGLLANPQVRTVRNLAATFTPSEDPSTPGSIQFVFGNGKITLSGNIYYATGGYGFYASDAGKTVSLSGRLLFANISDDQYAPSIIIESYKGQTAILTCDKPLP